MFPKTMSIKHLNKLNETWMNIRLDWRQNVHELIEQLINYLLFALHLLVKYATKQVTNIH